MLLPCHQSTGSCSSARKACIRTYAPYTPVAVCPVIRHLTDLSQKGYTPFGFDDIKLLNDASSMGLLSFVFRMLTLLGGLALELFAPTLTTADVGRSSLEWFETCS